MPPTKTAKRKRTEPSQSAPDVKRKPLAEEPSTSATAVAAIAAATTAVPNGAAATATGKSKLNREPYQRWRAEIGDDVLPLLGLNEIKGERGTNYWVSAIRSGQKCKFRCRVPPGILSVRDPHFGGSGRCFQNNLLEGKRSAKLCVEPDVIREAIATLYQCPLDQKLPDEAAEDVKWLTKEADDFVMQYQKIREHILGMMFDAKIMVTAHTLNVEPDPSKQRRRYIANGQAPPKKQKDSEVYSYYDPEDMPKWALTQIEIRSAAWKQAFQQAGGTTIEKMLQDADERADEEIATCVAHNSKAGKNAQWTFKTARLQKSQCLAPEKPRIFQPLLVKSARDNRIIPCPWDASPVSDGDLFSCELSFKITTKDSNVWLRNEFSEPTLHFKTKQTLVPLYTPKTEKTEEEYRSAPVETSSMDQPVDEGAIHFEVEEEST